MGRFPQSRAPLSPYPALCPREAVATHDLACVHPVPLRLFTTQPVPPLKDARFFSDIR